MKSTLPYSPLHCHSTFSSLDGAAKPKDLAARCAELEHAACALTDHGNVLGHFDFFHAMRSAGVRPILGVEAYHVGDVTAYAKASEGERKKGERKAFEYAHLTILARTQAGYQNLLKLVTESYRAFYYKPLVDAAMLQRHQEGLTVLSGCVIGRVSQLINEGREEDAFRWLRWYAANLESFYVEVIPCPGLPISETALPVLYRMATELALPMVATDDAHFCLPEEFIVQDTMLCANTNQKVFDAERSIKLPEIHYRCDGEEVLARLAACLPNVPEVELAQMVARSVEIAAACEDVELPRAGSPVFTVPDLDLDAETYLVGEAVRGLFSRFDASRWEEIPEGYEPRLRRELDTINRCGLSNYVLVVHDLVREMRKRGILVVPRGSAGGSLVLWALGVTVVDPLTHNLPFERFLDENKRDLDIDLDFQHDRRHEAFEYLEARYGAENCAHVANVVTFGARQALIDGGKALSIDEAVIARLAYLVPEGEGADLGLHDDGVLHRLFATNERAQKLLAEEPKLAIVAHLEGHVKTTSVHAGGFIVSDRPIETFTAVMQRPIREAKKGVVGHGDRVASLSKDQVAALGALKIDCLGSKTLTAIAETLTAIGQTPEWLYNLPLEDADVFAMLSQGRNLGIFQLQGNAAGRILRKLQPAAFDEFTAVSALARPGPLQSGSVDRYIARKHGWEAMPTLHPLLGAVLNPTQGVVLYQEQVMALAAAAGFDVADVQKLRKLVSKIGGGDAVDEYRDAFLTGCVERGVPAPQAASVWEQCKKAGNYLFCQAHAVQYAYVGMWTGYLKVNYPDLFTAALCRNVGSLEPEERQFALLREFVEQGGVVDLVDPIESGVHFGTGGYGIRIVGGYQSLKNCGPKTAPKVAAKAPFTTWEDLYAALGRRVGLPLAASGVASGRLDSDVLQGLAPWYPLRPLTDEELLERGKAGVFTIADTVTAVRHGYRADVVFLGRVTRVVETDLIAQAKKYGNEPPAPGEPTARFLLQLTDETGSVDVSFSAKVWRDHKDEGLTDGPGKGLGNSIAVEAWWSDDFERFFARRAVCTRYWQPFAPPPLPSRKKGQEPEEEAGCED